METLKFKVGDRVRRDDAYALRQGRAERTGTVIAGGWRPERNGPEWVRVQWNRRDGRPYDSVSSRPADGLTLIGRPG